MFANLLWFFAAICLLLGFIAFLGLHTFAVGVAALFIAAAVFALAAYFIAGGFPSRRRV